ncbi:hypothetical protein Vretimale_18678 [Volvox reticuliferus]|uniref:Uncharacterized protein n=1 Tax=Volvox reticuliferus TaxID=1737510 RepID=A0A8J4FYH9_9CHLO|nr:hypothetical protein Vretifemale_17204 [Volvox reticuliferus]GIM16048.1 hypothetical protein Vretimale_18678 [Volvox reticuliferus]
MMTAAHILGDGVQRQNLDALATVLGVCLLIIGLCAFAGIVLLFQSFQRGSVCLESAPIPAVPRRTVKPNAITSQFRPLSEGLRHRGELPRQLSGLADRGASVVCLADNTDSAMGSYFSRSSGGRPSPSVSGTTTPVPSGPAAPAPVADGNAASSSAPHAQVTSGSLYSGKDGTHPRTATTPVDQIDIELLSRIDEALSSGYMRPQQASKLLKSYGCDVEELLNMEFECSSSAEGVARLSSAPVLGTRRLAPVGPAGINTAPPGGADASTPEAACDGATATSISPFPGPVQPYAAGGPANTDCMSQQQQPGDSYKQPGHSSGLVRSAGSASNSSLLSTGGGTAIDDALLLKIDMALASGCVRPEQASQLLKSYGCNLEELLREELGEAALLYNKNGNSGFPL